MKIALHNTLLLSYSSMRYHTCERGESNVCLFHINYLFRNLQFLAEFENLTSLNLDHNEIDDHTVFPHMPKLQLLWLNHNNIGELYPFVKNLYESVPNLRYLCLMGNKAAPSYLNGGTFYDYLQYRYEKKQKQGVIEHVHKYLSICIACVYDFLYLVQTNVFF